MKEVLTQEKLKELLEYDSDTGIFIWKVSTANRIKVGDTAGSLCHDYIQIQIDSKIYKAHRLVWLYVHGYFPEHGIDHKNRIRSDNCIDNLREASQSCNMRNAGMLSNNISGVKGVCYHKAAKKWQAYIKTTEINIYLGIFKNFDEAVKARWNAEVKYNFPNCNTSSSAYLYLNENC